MSRCIESNNMEQLQYDGSLPGGTVFGRLTKDVFTLFCCKLFAEHSMALRALFLSVYIFLRNIIKSKWSKDQHNTAISVIYDSPIMHDFLGKHQTSKVLTSMKKYKSTHGKLSSSWRLFLDLNSFAARANLQLIAFAFSFGPWLYTKVWLPSIYYLLLFLCVVSIN